VQRSAASCPALACGQYCGMKLGHYKLKCQKECVSVLALRGPGVLRADRQQQRSQIKKAIDNQEENSE
jgi:hypothetical protein